MRSCGTYPPDVWAKLWSKNGRRVFRHFENAHSSLPECVATIKEKSGGVLFRPEFFEDRECANLGVTIRTVKPIIQFPGNEVELRYNVGTRSNGVDEPRWPHNLMVSVIGPEPLKSNRH